MPKFKLIFLIAIIVIGAVAALVIIFGVLGPEPSPMEITWWGTFDDSDAFSGLIDKYKREHPYIKSINYRKIPFGDYEKELIDALAEGRGPDIFSIHNTWLPKHISKIYPLPQEEGMMTFREFDEIFADVAKSDLTRQGQIYGIPFYVDTLALYYNKDIFNSAGIALPPKTWEEFQNTVRALTRIDGQGNIVRAGAAIGAAKNVNRSTDILSLAMLQSGISMVDVERQTTAFNRSVQSSDGSYHSGQEALEFYTKFADPNLKPSFYTWNLSQSTPYSINAFSQGRAAMMINYSHQIQTARAESPYLNFDVSYVPQISGRTKDVNYANYWAQAVSSNIRSAKAKEAWKFLTFISEKENIKTYLTKTDRPTARKDLVDWQKNDPDLGIFAEQSLSAVNWYQPDNLAVEGIFIDMIDSVVLGERTAREAINWAADQVNVLMR